MRRCISSAAAASNSCRAIQPCRRTQTAKSGAGVALFLVEQAKARWPVPEAKFGDASVGNLDHIVVQTTDAERAVALYGGRLGLDLRLDRTNEQWGARQLFFRTGGAVVEVGASLKTPVSDAKDSFGGLA